jgi:hypothetical protein
MSTPNQSVRGQKSKPAAMSATQNRRAGDKGLPISRAHGQCVKCKSPELIRQDRTKKATRFICTDCGHTMRHPVMTDLAVRHDLPKKRRYIITVAQNATPVHKRFWKTLLQAKEYYDAELVVLRVRYKNPTSIWTQKNAEAEWWDPAVAPYLFARRKQLNSRIEILGNAMVQCASSNPLDGFDPVTHERSGIIGHPRRELKSVAVPSHKHPKLMLTTGACTLPNYTDTKRGMLGDFNHTIGAVIVELDKNDTYYVRQINADADGSFIDLDVHFTPTGAWEAPRALSLALGDAHHPFMAPHVKKATFDSRDSMVKLLKPECLVWHDLLDQYARNHHHLKDWLVQLGKHMFGMGNVENEVHGSIDFVNKKTPADCTSIVVSSNHDRALERWLLETDFRNDPENVIFYLETALASAKSVRLGVAGDIIYDEPFVLIGRKLAASNVRMLSQGESCVVGDVELGLHGDIGPNGTRGTTRNLSRLGVKVNKGHDHTGAIIGGCYSVGTSTAPRAYERNGPSTHSNCHCIQYANGKRSLIFIVNGKWCLPR